jgi:ATP-dependent Clp protease ATP-binding subunit ClpA
VDGGRLTVDIDAEEQVKLDIQPPKKSDKPRAEATAA